MVIRVRNRSVGSAHQCAYCAIFIASSTFGVANGCSVLSKSLFSKFNWFHHVLRASQNSKSISSFDFPMWPSIHVKSFVYFFYIIIAIDSCCTRTRRDQIPKLVLIHVGFSTSSALFSSLPPPFTTFVFIISFFRRNFMSALNSHWAVKNAEKMLSYKILFWQNKNQTRLFVRHSVVREKRNHLMLKITSSIFISRFSIGISSTIQSMAVMPVERLWAAADDVLDTGCMWERVCMAYVTTAAMPRFNSMRWRSTARNKCPEPKTHSSEIHKQPYTRSGARHTFFRSIFLSTKKKRKSGNKNCQQQNLTHKIYKNRFETCGREKQRAGVSVWEREREMWCSKCGKMNDWVLSPIRMPIQHG